MLKASWEHDIARKVGRWNWNVKKRKKKMRHLVENRKYRPRNVFEYPLYCVVACSKVLKWDTCLTTSPIASASVNSNLLPTPLTVSFHRKIARPCLPREFYFQSRPFAPFHRFVVRPCASRLPPPEHLRAHRQFKSIKYFNQFRQSSIKGLERQKFLILVLELRGSKRLTSLAHCTKMHISLFNKTLLNYCSTNDLRHTLKLNNCCGWVFQTWSAWNKLRRRNRFLNMRRQTCG